MGKTHKESGNKKNNRKVKKDKKTKKSRPVQQPLVFAAQPQPQDTSSSSSSSSSSSTSSSESSAAQKDALVLWRGATTVAKLHRRRLQDIIEHLCPELDSIHTAELDQEALLMHIFILVRTKPTTKVVNFRAKTYKQLNEKFCTRLESFKQSQGPEIYAQLLSELNCVKVEDLPSFAKKFGWQDDFIQQASAKAKPKVLRGSARQPSITSFQQPWTSNQVSQPPIQSIGEQNPPAPNDGFVSNI